MSGSFRGCWRRMAPAAGERQIPPGPSESGLSGDTVQPRGVASYGATGSVRLPPTATDDVDRLPIEVAFTRMLGRSSAPRVDPSAKVWALHSAVVRTSHRLNWVTSADIRA